VTVALAALLGVVQGVTEFLPISSKTHLVVVPALLGERPPSLAFITLLHLGTFVALLVYFARDLWNIAADVIANRPDGRRLAVLLVVGTIPAVVVGFLLEEVFERLLRNPQGAALALLATTVILVSAEWVAGAIGRRPARPVRSAPTMRDAVTMGLSQTVAFLPGVSRSGVTMSAGLAGGLARHAAARFSFLMAIPAIAGAGVLELPEAIEAGIGTPELVGLAVALVSGYASVALLLAYLRRWSFLPFAAYCLVFGLAAWFALG
jgi:undecaprenyl-diphosphatase